MRAGARTPMSSRRRLPVELSPDAQDDYTGILFYSAEQWGNTQRDTYNAALERALRRIGDHPRIGPARPDSHRVELRFPRTRGDRPIMSRAAACWRSFPPHPRGSAPTVDDSEVAP